MTVPEAIYDQPTGESATEVLCPACRAKLGVIVPVTVDFAVGDGWFATAIGEGPDAQPDWEQGPRLRRTKSIGLRTDLAPGFGNAKRRHPETGLPHYVRAGHPERRGPRIRLPAVVTCKCGQDARIGDSLTAQDKAFAQMDAKTRKARLEAEAEDEGADIAAESDSVVSGWTP